MSHLALDLSANRQAEPRVGRQDHLWLDTPPHRHARFRWIVGNRVKRRGSHMIWTGGPRFSVVGVGNRIVSTPPARLVWWAIRNEPPPPFPLVSTCNVAGCVAPDHRRPGSGARSKPALPADMALLAEYEMRPRRLSDAAIGKAFNITGQYVGVLRRGNYKRSTGKRLTSDQIVAIRKLATPYTGPLRWIHRKAAELECTTSLLWRRIERARRARMEEGRA